MTLKSFDDSTTDEARLFLLDRRNERNHPKRHRTLGRRKRMAARKRARVKHNLSMLTAQRSRYLSAVRAYWSGLSEGHP